MAEPTGGDTGKGKVTGPTPGQAEGSRDVSKQSDDNQRGDRQPSSDTRSPEELADFKEGTVKANEPRNG